MIKCKGSGILYESSYVCPLAYPQNVTYFARVVLEAENCPLGVTLGLTPPESPLMLSVICVLFFVNFGGVIKLVLVGLSWGVVSRYLLNTTLFRISGIWLTVFVRNK